MVKNLGWEGVRGVVEVPCFVQPRAEQSEGRPHKGRGGAVLSSALLWQWCNTREWHGATLGEVRLEEKVLHLRI